MISKSEIKLITSLGRKKYRNEYKLFVAEGEKLIRDLLDSGLHPHVLLATETVSNLSHEIRLIDSRTLQKLSGLKNSNGWLAVFEFPKSTPVKQDGFLVALDAVRDPGNLGTIIRLCDWFGVEQLICSTDTVDCYNPKVIQATMGSIARVEIHYRDLKEFLTKTHLPCYAAVLEGEEVYGFDLPEQAVLLMGSEAHGISDDLLTTDVKKVRIPNFSKGAASAESLNVATASAILMHEFRRPTGR